MLQEAGVVDEQVGRLAAGDEEERRRATEFVRRLIAAGQLDRLGALAVSHVDKEVRLALDEMLQHEQTEDPEQAEGSEPVEEVEEVEGSEGAQSKHVEQVAAAVEVVETIGDPGLVEGPTR
jgi:hypothetical protein